MNFGGRNEKMCVQISRGISFGRERKAVGSDSVEGVGAEADTAREDDRKGDDGETAKLAFISVIFLHVRINLGLRVICAFWAKCWCIARKLFGSTNVVKGCPELLDALSTSA